MRKKIKELYEHSTLVAKIRYSYLCLLVPFVLFLIFCFYNLWNNNRRYEDMINSSVMASQFSLDFQKDFEPVEVRIPYASGRAFRNGDAAYQHNRVLTESQKFLSSYSHGKPDISSFYPFIKEPYYLKSHS